MPRELDIIISKINEGISQLSGEIQKMTVCIETLEEKEQKTMEAIVENAEEIGSVEIPTELSRALTELQENIRNKFISNSLLVSAYSFLESSLNLLCRYVNNILKPKKRLPRFRNLSLPTCKKYFKKEIDIDLEQGPYYTELDTIRKIRNLIVHNNSNIRTYEGRPVEGQNDYELFNEMKSLDVTRTGYIFITNMTLIENFIDQSIEFLEYVKNKISEQIKKDIESKKEPE